MREGPIRFVDAYGVVHVVHALMWRDRAPAEAIGLMMEDLRNGRLSLVLETDGMGAEGSSIGLVMPSREEDQGALIMHVWSGLKGGLARLHGIMRITADDEIEPLVGESRQLRNIVFAPSVRQALASWRQRKP
jgi:hypothetical protein